MTTALVEGAAPEFVRMRAERRRRLLEAMAAHDLDVLVLGRPANVAYASGARQLWTAGSRPFSPLCVVVADGARVHLLSVADDGVPAEIAPERLYGLTWNPAILTASLGAIPGLAGARRVGTDSATPGFPLMLAAAAPGAELVDGRPAVWAARTTKTPDELTCITAATAIAETALGAMVDALRPGITERDLLGVYLESIASQGAPTPPTEDVARISGDLAALDPGAMVAGYEGGVGRTFPIGPPTSSASALGDRCREALDALVAACRPGATGRDIKAAWTATGEPLPAVPIVHGLGLGMEPPLIGDGTGDDAELVAGMVLSVSARVGDFLLRTVVPIDQ